MRGQWPSTTPPLKNLSLTSGLSARPPTIHTSARHSRRTQRWPHSPDPLTTQRRSTGPPSANASTSSSSFLTTFSAPVNALGGDHWSTALHWAATKGAVAVMAALIAHGADTSIRDSAGYEPVHIATQHGHTFAVIYLLALGTCVDVPERGRTSTRCCGLHTAATLNITDAAARGQPTQTARTAPARASCTTARARATRTLSVCCSSTAPTLRPRTARAKRVPTWLRARAACGLHACRPSTAVRPCSEKSGRASSGVRRSKLPSSCGAA